MRHSDIHGAANISRTRGANHERVTGQDAQRTDVMIYERSRVE